MSIIITGKKIIIFSFQVPTSEWLSAIMPSFNDMTNNEPLNFTNLNVDKLLVSYVNGIPWNEFVSSAYVSNGNDVINGKKKEKKSRRKLQINNDF